MNRRKFLEAFCFSSSIGFSEIVKAQIVGGGENESQWAANKAAQAWQSYAKDNKNYTKWIQETIQRRAMQFYQYGSGGNFQQGAEFALKNAINLVSQDFQMLYIGIEKDKEEASILKAWLKGYISHEMSRDEQWKLMGSMNRTELAPTAEKFVQEYTDSLNRYLQSKQGSKTLSSVDTEKIAAAMVLHLFATENGNEKLSESLTQIFVNIIKIYNNKDNMLGLYNGILQRHNEEKNKDPVAAERVKKSFLGNVNAVNSIINDLNAIINGKG